MLAGVLACFEALVVEPHGLTYRLVTNPGDRSDLVDEGLVVGSVADRTPGQQPGRPTGRGAQLGVLAEAPGHPVLHWSRPPGFGRGHGDRQAGQVNVGLIVTARPVAEV